MQSPVCKFAFAFLSLFIVTVISQQQTENDYSQMFMVCSPVYSRYELQKILETSINSLAFQIPVNPLQKLRVSSLSKLNSNLNEIPILQKNNSQSPGNRSSSDENAKRSMTTRQPEREAPTTLPTTIQTESTTTVQPVSSTSASVRSTTSTTAASPTTPEAIRTTSQAPTTLPSSTSSPIAGRPVRARPSLKRYTNYYRPSSTTSFVPNAGTSTTESPSIELSPVHKPAMAKIRSRLFNLFQPRPFNSNILHKPRPVDYPTLTPQSLFSLNSNSLVQPPQAATSTTTGKPGPSNKLIYSSTESYPQIQSSLLPQSAGEQTNVRATTSSPLVDGGLLKTKEDLNASDKSKVQPTNDNLLAVASSSRFHSVLNSNQEKLADKLEKSEKSVNGNEAIKEAVSNKQSEDKLSDKVDDSHFESLTESPSDSLNEGNKNANEKQTAGDKESAGKEEAALTGPLNLDEIFSDFGEPANETTYEASTASNLPDGDKEANKVVNKEATKETVKTETVDKSDLKLTPDQVSADQALHNDTPTESSIDGDGLIVRKISDVIESLSDEVNDGLLDAGDKHDQPRTAASTAQSDSTAKSSTKDNDPQIQDKSSSQLINRPPASEGHSKSPDSRLLKEASPTMTTILLDSWPADRSSKSSSDKPGIDKSNKFIEVPTTGTTVDRSAEDRAKRERLTREQLMKSQNEKSTRLLKEMATRERSPKSDQSISYRLESDRLTNDRLAKDKTVSDRLPSDKPASDRPLSDSDKTQSDKADKIVSDKFVGEKAINEEVLSERVVNEKNLNEKNRSEKASKARNVKDSRPEEVTERFVEDTPDEPPTTLMNENYETTTVKKNDDESKLNSYTYPIEFLI